MIDALGKMNIRIAVLDDNTFAMECYDRNYENARVLSANDYSQLLKKLETMIPTDALGGDDDK